MSAAQVIEMPSYGSIGRPVEFVGPPVCECGCGEVPPIVTKTDKRRGWVKGQHKAYCDGHFHKMPAEAKVAARHGAPVSNVGPGEQEITEHDVQNIRGMDDVDAADIYDRRIRALERNTKRTFMETGMICAEMEERVLWKKLVDPATNIYFHSYDAWLLSAAPISRSSAYSAKKAWSDLKAIPAADRLEMPRMNAMQLSKMSTSVQRDPEIIRKAKELSEEKFVEAVAEKHPAQHTESRRAMTVKPTQSARKALDAAIEVAMWAFDVSTREEALEAMAAAFMDAPCESEEYQGLSNRLAYNKARGKGKK